MAIKVIEGAKKASIPGKYVKKLLTPFKRGYEMLRTSLMMDYNKKSLEEKFKRIENATLENTIEEKIEENKEVKKEDDIEVIEVPEEKTSEPNNFDFYKILDTLNDMNRSSSVGSISIIKNMMTRIDPNSKEAIILNEILTSFEKIENERSNIDKIITSAKGNNNPYDISELDYAINSLIRGVYTVDNNTFESLVEDVYNLVGDKYLDYLNRIKEARLNKEDPRYLIKQVYKEAKHDIKYGRTSTHTK